VSLGMEQSQTQQAVMNYQTLLSHLCTPGNVDALLRLLAPGDVDALLRLLAPGEQGENTDEESVRD
jgi:hypothetical protein